MKINSTIRSQAGYQAGNLKKPELKATEGDRVVLGSQPLDVPPSLKDLKAGAFGLGSGDGCKDIMIVGELVLGTALGSGLGLIGAGLGWGARAIGGAPAGLATAVIAGGVFGYLDKSVTSGLTLGLSTALGSQFGGVGLLEGAAVGGIGMGLIKKGIVKDGLK